MGFLDGFVSLSRGVNKAKDEGYEAKEGVASEFSPQLTLDLEDKELIKLAKRWEEGWRDSKGRQELERKQAENEKYWRGDHHTPAQNSSGKRDLVDNLVFESLETALPFYTKQIAEPVVGSDNSPEGNALARKVGDRIKDVADTIRLRLKVKKVARHWAIYYFGILKIGWSLKHNEISVQVVRPQQMILDPEAITDECEYEGEYAGEYRKDKAEDLIERFPAKAEFIKEKVNSQLGTKIRYVEWWTPEMLFWTLEGEVLGKAKNPHWNYDSTAIIPATVDEYGAAVPQSEETVPGVNFFPSPKIPYAFFSIFSLGGNPFDDTNQIEQILPLQDAVNKRQRQIDRNADSMNAGAVVSGSAFTKEQAKQVADALRKGQTVWIPRGSVNDAYKRDAGTALPSFVYDSLVDYRNEIRNIFGTTGLSAQGIQKTETVRGKILVRGTDADRGSYIVDHLEQFYDYVYNWFVQMMYVYYDDPHNVSRYQGTTTIVNSEFVHPLVVSVKEGSLIPKDRLSLRNEAVDLWTSGALDPITLFERLEDSNPYEAARRLFLWKTMPAVLFPDVPIVSPPSETEKEPPGGPPSGEPKAEPESILSEVPIQ